MTKEAYFHDPRLSTGKFPNAVRHGELVFTSGHVGMGEDGNVIAPGDVVVQAARRRLAPKPGAPQGGRMIVPVAQNTAAARISPKSAIQKA